MARTKAKVLTKKEAAHKPASKRGKVSGEGTTQVRCSKDSCQLILGLADDLFLTYNEGHKALNLNNPSAKVAIDYLIIQAMKNCEYNLGTATEKNNIMMKIIEKQKEITKDSTEAT